MKIYITKSKVGIKIIKELWWKSILNDLVTLIVVGSLILLNMYFHTFSGGNLILDLFFVAMIICWISYKIAKEECILTKEEIKKMIDDL